MSPCPPRTLLPGRRRSRSRTSPIRCWGLTRRRDRRFMFTTGIECSCPVVGNNHRIDEMELCGHNDMWERDLQLVADLGISYLRYGPPYFKMHLGPGRYDWSFFDRVYARMEE